MTQKERLLNHLKTGATIQPLQAWLELGIYRLSDTVYQLRGDKYNIETNMIKVRNQFGEDCEVAEYRLVAKEPSKLMCESIPAPIFTGTFNFVQREDR